MTDRHGDEARTLSIAELIALGRDREAIEAATRAPTPAVEQHDPTNVIERGEPMDGVQQLDEIVPLIEAIVDQIGSDQLDNPTPCANFTVTGVLEHMIGGATAFAPGFRGEPSPEGAGATGGSVQDRWRSAMAELLGAVHSPGAQERTIASPFGEMPGAVFARIVAFDGLVHGWDLATATGLSYDPPAHVVGEVDTFTREVLQPEMRDGDTFAAETTTASDATQLERLVAFSGRQVPAKEASR